MKHLKFISVLFMATVAMFAFNACDDDLTEDKGKGSGGGSSSNDSTQIETAIIGTWETYAVIPEGGREITVNSTDPDVYAYWNRFIFDADGSFNGYAVNYQGSEGYRGRIEHTMLGTYAYKNNELQLNNLVMGYHEVKDYLDGNTNVDKINITAELISFSKDNLTYKADMGELGTVTIKMKKVSAIDDNPIENNDSIDNHNPDSLNVGGDDYATLLIGTWGTDRIYGTATDTITKNIVDSWDNYPTINDAELGKESLKYMEFTFGQNNYFGLHQFDEEARLFNEKYDGSWYLVGNTITAIIGSGDESMRVSVDIVELTKDKLVLHRQDIEEEFEVNKQEYTVICDETLYFSRK